MKLPMKLSEANLQSFFKTMGQIHKENIMYKSSCHPTHLIIKYS